MIGHLVFDVWFSFFFWSFESYLCGFSAALLKLKPGCPVTLNLAVTQGFLTPFFSSNKQLHIVNDNLTCHFIELFLHL